MSFREDMMMVIGALQHGMDFETAFSLVEGAKDERQKRRAARAPEMGDYLADVADMAMRDEMDPARLSTYAQLVSQKYNVDPNKATKIASTVGSSLGTGGGWDDEDDAAFFDSSTPESPINLVKTYATNPQFVSEDGLPDRAAIRSMVTRQLGVKPEEKVGFDQAFDRAFDMTMAGTDQYGQYQEKVAASQQQNAIGQALSQQTGLPTDEARRVAGIAGTDIDVPGQGSVADFLVDDIIGNVSGFLTGQRHGGEQVIDVPADPSLEHAQMFAQAKQYFDQQRKAGNTINEPYEGGIRIPETRKVSGVPHGASVEGQYVEDPTGADLRNYLERVAAGYQDVAAEESGEDANAMLAGAFGGGMGMTGSRAAPLSRILMGLGKNPTSIPGIAGSSAYRAGAKQLRHPIQLAKKAGDPADIGGMLGDMSLGNMAPLAGRPLGYRPGAALSQMMSQVGRTTPPKGVHPSELEALNLLRAIRAGV